VLTLACPHLRWLVPLSLSIAALAPPALAEAGSKTFENPQFQYSVALPSGCRHEEGPGTLDAVCSPELDAEKSADAAAAASLIFEVGAEPVPEDAGKSPTDLAQRYSEANFKDELPEAICGEADKARVKIGNIRRLLDDQRVVYTADVACPEIRFLGLGERDGAAKFVITPGVRYRLLARALKEDFDLNKSSVDAFFASFHTKPVDLKTP
jgi:hypothetical protein